MSTKKLTKTIIDAAPAPEKGDNWLWDSELPSFGVRIQTGGRKTYVIRYRVVGATQRKLTLCRCADMPPDRARDLARKMFAEVAEGKDPAAAKAAARAPKEKDPRTVEKLFKAYVAWMKAAGKASAGEVERMLLKSKRVQCAADALGRDTPARDVTTEQILKHVASYFDRGFPGAADKARSYIGSAYSWAIGSANDYTVKQRQDWGITVNPAAAIKRDQDATTEGERALDAAELRKLWDATFEDFTEDTGACVRVIAAVGQRVQETLRLAGREVDLEQRLWNMPAEKTKGRKHPLVIPLPEVIIPTLRRQIEKYGDAELFPSRPHGEEDQMDHRAINRAIRRWLDLEDNDMPHFTTRDLRRTWKTRTGEAGIDRFVRDLIQQHAKNDTGSKHYDKWAYLPQKREAMDTWSRWLGIVLAGGTPPAQGEPRIRAVA